MSTITQFNNPKTREEFLAVFESVCGITDSAFNKFEQEISKEGPKNERDIKSFLSYLISLMKVIRGLRGDSFLLRNDSLHPFFAEKDGIKYDQASLQKAEDYFCDRLNKALEVLKNIDQKTYESYLEMWRY
jgi:hypothetical protein